MSRQVCPNCVAETHLYSVERVVAHYSVDVTDGEIEYTGVSSDTYDETANPTGRIFCGECGWEGPIAEMVTTKTCRSCGWEIVPDEDGAWWLDSTGSASCETRAEGCAACDAGEAHPHEPGISPDA